MSSEQIQPLFDSPIKQSTSLKRQKRILKLSIVFLSIFLVGCLVVAAVEKFQDMSDRAK